MVTGATSHILLLGGYHHSSICRTPGNFTRTSIHCDWMYLLLRYERWRKYQHSSTHLLGGFTHERVTTKSQCDVPIAAFFESSSTTRMDTMDVQLQPGQWPLQCSPNAPSNGNSAYCEQYNIISFGWSSDERSFGNAYYYYGIGASRSLFCPNIVDSGYINFLQLLFVPTNRQLIHNNNNNNNNELPVIRYMYLP